MGSEYNINLPFGKLKFSTKEQDNVDAKKLENADWESAFNAAQKDESGKTAIKDIVDNALDNSATQAEFDILNQALMAVNNGEETFDNWEDFSTLDEDETSHLEELKEDYTLETEEETDKKEFAFSDKIKDKLLKDDETGQNYIEVEKWNSSKKDNLDCVSRIVYNSYGVSLYSDEGKKIYEEIAKSNNFDSDYNKVVLMPGQKIVLPTFENDKEETQAAADETQELEVQVYEVNDTSDPNAIACKDANGEFVYNTENRVTYNPDGSCLKMEAYKDSDLIQTRTYEYGDDGSYTVTYTPGSEDLTVCSWNLESFSKVEDTFDAEGNRSTVGYDANSNKFIYDFDSKSWIQDTSN